MTPPIAIVGMACRYADASSPAELWDNVLAQRRAFRRIPLERLSFKYFSPDPQAPDRLYCFNAALVEDFEFDRDRFRISGEAYRSADLAHWLALDVADRALADAGFENGNGLPRQSTAAYVGNTLTGEFSRAAMLRLRWPYVERVLSQVLDEEGCIGEHSALLEKMECAFKRPFPPVNEETLAGALSNTIGGRIANYFDLNGGCYTVDGACASSALAISTACSALAAHDCDAAIAGGVDLSLDPFELVGFSKIGALATDRMRVYDVHSGGFWPGEGCGFSVLMRHEDALSRGCRIYALIRGWGISSDGSGGITRPTESGQLLALKRAYDRAGFGPDAVGYFEGHGTGTAVGDSTELRAIATARRESGATSAAPIGSIKALIGHTKAAAGVAGMIKAAMALHAGVIPPTAGCESPHPEMSEQLRAVACPEPWPESVPPRAAVSGMGFGGINVHLALESAATGTRRALSDRERQLAQTPHEAELFVFRNLRQIEQAAAIAGQLSIAEMTDLAAALANEPAEERGRAAVVASTPDELASRLSGLALKPQPPAQPTIGFLFPGQGSQNGAMATEIAQPAIVKDSLAALRRLSDAGIDACVAIGHSIGELTALSWAGAIDECAAVRIAECRGKSMASIREPRGAMAAIAAAEADVRSLLDGEPVVIAGLNTGRQTVVSGVADAVSRIVAVSREHGISATLLQVSHAFHSPLIASAADLLASHLAAEEFLPLKRRVISTVTGTDIAPGADLRDLLRRQISNPVLFRQAFQHAGAIDLWIEVGPGHVLSGLAADNGASLALSVESGSRSERAFLETVAKAFACGVLVRPDVLFRNRFSKPLKTRRQFFINPCEAVSTSAAAPESLPEVPVPAQAQSDTTLDLVRRLVAEKLELPVSSLRDEARLMADLHLNSIVVAQIASKASRQMGISAPAAPLDYASLTVSEMAKALDSVKSGGAPIGVSPADGVAPWLRAFAIKLEPRPVRGAGTRSGTGCGTWLFFGPGSGALRPQVEAAQAMLPPESGVVLCAPERPDREFAGAMIQAAQALMSRPRGRLLVIQYNGGSVASFARSVCMELPEAFVTVVTVPSADPAALDYVLAETRIQKRYSEAHYDRNGVRSEPVWSVVEPDRSPLPFGPDDVLLVTGGGRGIGAECGIEFARRTGARLAILGTSEPGRNEELAANLGRTAGYGIIHEYFRCDVTDAAAVRRAVESAERRLGPITAVLHAAGINRPRAIGALDEAGFHSAIAVKVDGLRNLLGAINSSRLKLAMTFGSIIASVGLAGEAEYAIANEWMSRELTEWADLHPACRSLDLQWSVWAGAGMGERVGNVDLLRRLGVSPISIEEGIDAFLNALSYDLKGARTLVLTGRFGSPPTVRFHGELPLLRFLERVTIHYPGVELVAEAELSRANDPYLDDHVLSGVRLFPAAMALEAMAQIAMALTGRDRPPEFRRVRFMQPVVVPESGSLIIRLAALARSVDEVDVCLRSAGTGFQTDHFRAACHFGAPILDERIDPHPPRPVALDPVNDLYSSLFFQNGRFRRVRSYEYLSATESVAVAHPEPATKWFSRYLPSQMVAGDPAIRDAALHAIQASLPHARVLPGGASEIEVRTHSPADAYRLYAHERSRKGAVLIYDLDIATCSGDIVERWRGLDLRIVGPAPLPRQWPPALLGPYLERIAGGVLDRTDIRISVEPGGGSSPAAIRRPDGKPLPDGAYLSRSHSGPLTLTVEAPTPAGCDCEAVVARALEVWSDLLGAQRFSLARLLAERTGEKFDRSATRLWCAAESIKKAGLRQDTVTLLASETPGPDWVLLDARPARILTYVAEVSGISAPIAFAVLLETRSGDSTIPKNVWNSGTANTEPES